MFLRRLALGLALVFFAAGSAWAEGEATITLGTDPEPPNSAPNPGGVVTVFWEIQYSTTADSVYYRLSDPDGVVMEEQGYPGDSGVHVDDHTWTVPEGALGGSYWVRVEFYSVEFGNEANAEVGFLVGQATPPDETTWSVIKALFR